nr:hypothetical protein [Tanacetum cinerariifolium]
MLKSSTFLKAASSVVSRQDAANFCQSWIIILTMGFLLKTTTSVVSRQEAVKENSRKGQNRIKTGQKQEACQSQKKFKAVTVDRGRKLKKTQKEGPNVEISFRLEEFARILRVPCQGVCVFTPDWAILSLPNGVDSNPDIYPPPHEDFMLIRDSLFYERPP